MDGSRVNGSTAGAEEENGKDRAGFGKSVDFGRQFKEEWFQFDRAWVPLNHGSFGTHPRPIHTHRLNLLHTVESSPDLFFFANQAPALRSSRQALASLLEVPPSDVVLIPNATTGVNTILRNLRFAKGDQIAYFDVAYNAVKKTIESVCETTKAQALSIPFEVPAGAADASEAPTGPETTEARQNGASRASMVAAFEAAVLRERARGNEVKVLIFDTITSMPALRIPFEALTAKCRDLGVLSLIDGAHGIGQIPLSLGTLQPDFLVSNLHKWLFVPRGCAMLYVPRRNQGRIRTTFPTSHAFQALAEGAPEASGSLLSANGDTDPRDAGYFVDMFEFVGTTDVTNYMCVGEAIKFRNEICGGEAAIQEYLAKLAREGGDRVAKVLGTECMDNKEGSMRNDIAMVNVRLPLRYDQMSGEAAGNANAADWMRQRMLHDLKTWVPIFWHAGCLWVRFSAQVYLELADFEWGAERLRELCSRVGDGEHLAASKSDL